MLIRDILDKDTILCNYLEYKRYSTLNYELFEIYFSKNDEVMQYYRYKSYNDDFGQEDFEIVEDDEYYMYVTDKYLFVCKQEDKEWSK